MAITDWPVQERPRERLLALGAASLATLSCSRSCFVPASRERARRPRTPAARALRLRRQGCSMRDHRTSRRPRVWGAPSSRSQLTKAALELARRALKEESPREMRCRRRGQCADYLRLALADASRKSSLCCSSTRSMRHRIRGAVPRHADPDRAFTARVVKCSCGITRRP